jgi:hypothetical protein
MIAMAISFPCSFLDDMVFIFYGNTGEEMVANFHDVQDLEMHVLNIRGYISWITRREDYDFTEDFYVAFLEGAEISVEDVKRFFSLCPEVCKVLDFVEDEDARHILVEKYPYALCR